MQPKEFQIMTNMLKSAINREHEFTVDESNKFDELFNKIVASKIQTNFN